LFWRSDGGLFSERVADTMSAIGTSLHSLRRNKEKHEPASDIDIAAVDSLKALDPKRPIREADIQLAWILSSLIESARLPLPQVRGAYTAPR
jgi:hypothetical protein